MAEPFDYAEAAADALELIAEFGQVGAVRRRETTGGGPADPTGGTVTETDTPATLVVLPIDGRQVGQNVQDTTIQTTDVQIYVAAADLPLVPKTTDRIICANGNFAIMRCNALAPAGQAVLFDIIGRL
ncbi:hypothetical protein [Frigidibacter sp. MR17.24]|uniref:hypothetical protein n=1 Tax=Frigidibacter sp. MR17.24 TaxID=3127345 RepID=UPI003012E214